MPVVAVEGIAVVVAAVVALLFLLAYGKFRDAIHQDVTFVVGIGPFSVDLLGWVVSAADYVYAVLLAVLDGWTAPLATAISAPFASVESAFLGIEQAASQTAGAVANLYWGVIPRITNLLTGQLGAQLNESLTGVTHIGDQVLTITSQLQTTFQGEFAGIVNLEANDVAHLQAEINSLTRGATLDVGAVTSIATGVATTVVDAALGTVQDAITTAVGDAATFTHQVAADLLGDIDAGVARAEAFAATAATNAFGALVTDIDNAITAGLSAIWPDIATVIPELEGVIGTGDADILDALKRIDWTIPATLAGVASLVGVTSLTLARYLKDCGIPNCQNLSQLGQDLQAAIAVVDSAAFLEFIIELIHQPASAAQLFITTVGDVITGGEAIVRDLVSI